jgi:3-carboxy-cis,cis-muconate cycloisomerase
LAFDGLFIPDELREAVSDRAWVRAMLAAERALATVQGFEPVDLDVDPEELARDGRRAGNPVEPLVRLLRAASEDAHHGATSQDIMDTAAALVARDAKALVLQEVDGLAAACARLADRHRDTVMAGRTLLQQATPTTFGLKAAGWLVGLVQARAVLREIELPAELGGASGTLAAFGDRGLEIRHAFARELGLPEPVVSWHTMRVPVAVLGARLGIAAGVVEKIALDVVLLAQTEVAEVREPHQSRPGWGGSSTMPHKRNPVGSTLARACAMRACAAAGALTATVAQEHERAAGAWHAEWSPLCELLSCTGGAAWWMRRTLEGLEVDAARMRANIDPGVLSEAATFAPDASRPEDYLGSAGALVDRALALYRAQP